MWHQMRTIRAHCPTWFQALFSPIRRYKTTTDIPRSGSSSFAEALFQALQDQPEGRAAPIFPLACQPAKTAFDNAL